MPFAPINDYAAAVGDPQVQAMAWLQEIVLPNGRPTRTFASPIVLDGIGLGIRNAPPDLGAHNDEIIAELMKTAVETEEHP